MSVNLKDLLKRIIQDMGGEIVDRDDDYIWVKMGEGVFEVYYLVDREKVTGDHVIMFARNTEQVKGDKAIFCVKGYDDLALNTAKKMHIMLIPREKLASLIGNYILNVYEQVDEMPLFEEDDVEVEDIVFDDGDEDEENDDEDEYDQDVIPIIIEDVGEGEEKIIRPNIVSEEDARGFCEDFLYVYKVHLQLKPYYMFEFVLKVILEGSAESKAISGIIAVDALDGHYEIWKTGFETTANLDVPYWKLEPEVPLEFAESRAREGLVKEYTTEKEIFIEDSAITVIEKRKTHPLENSININHIGLHYLPVWVCEGREGKVYLNAVTKEIIKKDLHDLMF